MSSIQTQDINIEKHAEILVLKGKKYTACKIPLNLQRLITLAGTKEILLAHTDGHKDSDTQSGGHTDHHVDEGSSHNDGHSDRPLIRIGGNHWDYHSDAV